jgi:hypothetical protein
MWLGEIAEMAAHLKLDAEVRARLFGNQLSRLSRIMEDSRPHPERLRQPRADHASADSSVRRVHAVGVAQFVRESQVVPKFLVRCLADARPRSVARVLLRVLVQEIQKPWISHVLRVAPARCRRRTTSRGFRERRVRLRCYLRGVAS